MEVPKSRGIVAGLGIGFLGGPVDCSRSIGVGLAVLFVSFGHSMHLGLFLVSVLLLNLLACRSCTPNPSCLYWHLGTRWCCRVPWHGNACIGPWLVIGEGGSCCCSALLHSSVSTCWTSREGLSFLACSCRPFSGMESMSGRMGRAECLLVVFASAAHKRV